MIILALGHFKIKRKTPPLSDPNVRFKVSTHGEDILGIDLVFLLPI